MRWALDILVILGAMLGVFALWCLGAVALWCLGGLLELGMTPLAWWRSIKTAPGSHWKRDR